MVWVLLTKSVSDRRTLTAVLGLLLIVMGAFVGALWPPMRDTFADLSSGLMDDILRALPGADMTTGAGWANAELMSMVAPAAIITVAVVSAARATAGEEEAKTLGMLLSAPVSRLMFLSVKTAAMTIHVLIVGAFLAVGLMVGNLIGNLGLTPAGILGATAHTVLLGIFFGMVAILIGAATGNGRLTTAGTGTLAGIAFVMSAILPLSNTLAEGAKASPWYYFNASNPLVNGFDPQHLAILAGASVVLASLAMVIFRARDLRG